MYSSDELFQRSQSSVMEDLVKIFLSDLLCNDEMTLRVKMYTDCSWPPPNVFSEIRNIMYKPPQTEWESLFFTYVRVHRHFD